MILSLASLVLFAGPLLAAPPDRVTPEELKTTLDNSEPVVLIDVRTPEEFAAGHIPGSRSMPVDTLEGVERLPEGKIILYCKAGKRTQRAFEILSKKGFTGLSVLDGGLDAWKASGGKVDPPPPEPQKYNLPSPFHLNADLRPQAGPR